MEVGLCLLPLSLAVFSSQTHLFLKQGVTEAKVRSMQTQLPYRDSLGQGNLFLPALGYLEDLPPVPIALEAFGSAPACSCPCTLCCAHTTSVAPCMERPTAMWPGHQLSFCHVLGLQRMQPSRHPLRFFSLNLSLRTEEAGECLLHG